MNGFWLVPGNEGPFIYCVNLYLIIEVDKMNGKGIKGARAIGAFALALSGSSPAYAHGFGQRYDLPVPLWLYLIGAASAVVFSFLVIGLFVRSTPGFHDYPRWNVLRWWLGRLLAHSVTLLCYKLLSVGLFVLVVVAGVFGSPDPGANFTPLFVWVIWWVGLAYVSALAGNLWALVNPWKVLFAWAEALYRRLHPKKELSFQLPYPQKLGAWPGFLLCLIFVWTELVFKGRMIPANIALMVLGYSLITWLGMLLFGRERWLQQGECFSLVFGLLARFAPTEVRVIDSEICTTCDLGYRDDHGACINCYEGFEFADNNGREWNVRPFAIGLLRDETISFSMMAFVILLLSTVT